MARLREAHFPVPDYDLAATLDSGQAFRWRHVDGAWEGVIGQRWVRLRQDRRGILAQSAEDPGDWGWLRSYLALDEDMESVLATFPADPPLREAVRACRGLRLLRQDPWECLASFLLSSNKQIVQIRQVVGAICRCWGDAVAEPDGGGGWRSFPAPGVVAAAGEADLRACRMGYRAKYVKATAGIVAAGGLDLAELAVLPLEAARQRLMALPGVGRKIADCVLLFSCGQKRAFPVDVWVMRALRELYFPKGNPRPAELLAFSETHFGPNGGYAQQYLFHYMRLRAGRVAAWGR